MWAKIKYCLKLTVCNLSCLKKLKALFTEHVLTKITTGGFYYCHHSSFFYPYFRETMFCPLLSSRHHIKVSKRCKFTLCVFKDCLSIQPHLYTWEKKMILWNHLIYLILRPSKVLCPDMQNISYSNSTRTQLDAKIPNEKGIFFFLVQQKQQGHGVTCNSVLIYSQRWLSQTLQSYCRSIREDSPLYSHDT